MMNTQHIERLKLNVENTLGRKLQTPRDFDFLSERIFARLNTMISPTTLKRLWGYLKESTSPRIYTLDILSKYIGYDNWNKFCQSFGNREDVQSNFIVSRSLLSEELKRGDRILVTWLPDRKCVFEYTGNNAFRVISTENSKLKSGATFKCSTFIEEEPLYIDQLQQDGLPPVSYVAGKINGIRFEVIKKNK